MPDPGLAVPAFERRVRRKRHAEFSKTLKLRPGLLNEDLHYFRLAQATPSLQGVMQVRGVVSKVERSSRSPLGPPGTAALQRSFAREYHSQAQCPRFQTSGRSSHTSTNDQQVGAQFFIQHA